MLYHLMPTESALSAFRRAIYTGEEPPEILDKDQLNPKTHHYSRYTQPVSTRAEKVLGNICVRYFSSLFSYPMNPTIILIIRVVMLPHTGPAFRPFSLHLSTVDQNV